MKESDVEEASVGLIDAWCPGAVIYKHADRWTAGIPDRSVTWRGCDSWLEYKLWDPNTTFHDEFAVKESGRPNVQLIELLKLEKQTGRAWVVAYRKAGRSQIARLELYCPSAWVDKAGFVLKTREAPLAKPSSLENVAWNLRVNGLAMFQGHDHRAVVSLIHLTHRKEYDPQ